MISDTKSFVNSDPLESWIGELHVCIRLSYKDHLESSHQISITIEYPLKQHLDYSHL